MNKHITKNLQVWVSNILNSSLIGFESSRCYDESVKKWLIIVTAVLLDDSRPLEKQQQTSE